VGLYPPPPESTIVLRLGGKFPIQKPVRSAPMLPGDAKNRTHDYRRHRTTVRLAALEIATGHGDRRRQVEAQQPVVPRFPAPVRSGLPGTRMCI
jgi:hypothetical protein